MTQQSTRKQTSPQKNQENYTTSLLIKNKNKNYTKSSPRKKQADYNKEMENSPSIHHPAEKFAQKI